MANTGNKKVRHIKNVGSVYYDSTTDQWVGQVENGRYANGRIKFKRFYAGNQEEVIRKMRNFKGTITAIDDEPMTNTMSVTEFFESYLTNIKKVKLKPSSYTRDVCTWNNNIKPYIGGYRLSDLTPNIVQNQLIHALLQNPKQLSYSTIHKAYVLTNEALKYAVKQELISTNPCERVEVPQKRVFTQTKEIRFFDDDEITRFVNTALTTHWFRTEYNNSLAIVSLIYTGLRAGEFVSLRWRDINFKEKYIKVKANVAIVYDKQAGRQVIEQNSTKTRKSRIVHLTKTAEKYLSDLYTIRKPPSSDYVYICNGERDLSTLSTSYAAICKRANINDPQGLHTLRHTFASLMIRKGVDIKIISEMLGHASVSFTYNTYVHLIEEEKAKIIQQLDI